jgi:hypothetical protein
MCFGLCDFVKNICITVMAFVLCGYIGKGIYLFGGQDDVVLNDELKKPSFYTPDGTFIIMGIVLFVLVLVVLTLIKVLCNQTVKCSKGACFCLFSQVFCRCCFDESELTIEGEPKYNKLKEHEMADLIIDDDYTTKSN